MPQNNAPVHRAAQERVCGEWIPSDFVHRALGVWEETKQNLVSV